MEKYGIIIAFVVVVIGVIIKLILDEIIYQKKARQKLIDQWGEFPVQKYTYEKMEAIRFYHNKNKGVNDVDDITWNDLDMDEIYTLLNHTESSIGEEYLYDLLHKPVLNENGLKERNSIAEYFSNHQHEEERLALQGAIHRMGKVKNFSVYEYLNRLKEAEPTNRFFHIICALLIPASVVICFIQPPLGFLLLFLSFCHNTVRYYQKKKCMEKYYSLISYMLAVLQGIRKINNATCEITKPYTDRLIELSRRFAKFKRGYFIVISGKTSGGNVGGSPIDFLLDYIRMLFHVDLIKFNTMIREMSKNEDALNEIFSIVGLLDCDLAIASYRELFKDQCCIPEFVTGKQVTMEVEGVYHPLIEEPIGNSIKESRSVLITGSNASGKSTFIKTVAINAILAQTIDTVMAESYRASIFRIYSSMALQDNLFSQESYYMVEIKSLKRIMDAMNDETPILCFIDEVLRGTNTLERIASSSQILSQLANGYAMCFAATHDIELTHILQSQYSNYHFQEEVTDNDITFDYRIYEGRAMSRNAIRLLQLIGYDRSITKRAEEMADQFLQTGKWCTINGNE